MIKTTDPKLAERNSNSNSQNQPLIGRRAFVAAITALPANHGSGSVAENGQLSAGPVGGSVQATTVSVSGQMAASWPGARTRKRSAKNE